MTSPNDAGSDTVDLRADMPLPHARSKGLVVRELADEMLVYDLERNRAHCLNPAAALIWKRCDGQTTVGEAARLLREGLGEPVDEQIVWYALAQLEKDRLLVDPVSGPLILPRRQLVRILGVSALAMPVISSLVAPAAAAAASCLPKHTAGCTSCTQCCSASPSTPPCSPIYGSGCCKTEKGRNGKTGTVCGTINAQGACT
jgi:hypothetical protein